MKTMTNKKAQFTFEECFFEYLLFILIYSIKNVTIKSFFGDFSNKSLVTQFIII
jgi:hypothetical protein